MVMYIRKLSGQMPVRNRQHVVCKIVQRIWSAS